MSDFLDLLYLTVMEASKPVERKWFRGTNGNPPDFARGVYLIDDPELAYAYGTDVQPWKVEGGKFLTATHKENAINRPALVQRARAAGYDGISLPKDFAFAKENVYDEAEHDVLILLKPGIASLVEARESADLKKELLSFGLDGEGKSVSEMEAMLAAVKWTRDHPNEEFPEQLTPMLAGDASKMPVEWLKTVKDTDWWVQEKMNGMRSILSMKPGKVVMTSRTKSVVTNRYEEHQDKVPHFLNMKVPFEGKTVLDGELTSAKDKIDTGGTISSSKLQAAVAIVHSSPEKAAALQQKYGPLIFNAFDILFLNGNDVRNMPYEERAGLVDEAVSAIQKLNPGIPLNAVPVIKQYADVSDIFNQFTGKGAEGVMLKHRKLKYEPTRSKQMLKLKREMTVDGWISGAVRSDKYDAKGMIAGFEISSNVEGKGVQVVANITNIPNDLRKDATVQTEAGPALNPAYLNRTLEVLGQEFTKSDKLVHARMVQWRPDKKPSECFVSKEMLQQPSAAEESTMSEKSLSQNMLESLLQTDEQKTPTSDREFLGQLLKEDGMDVNMPQQEPPAGVNDIKDYDRDAEGGTGHVAVQNEAQYRCMDCGHEFTAAPRADPYFLDTVCPKCDAGGEHVELVENGILSAPAAGDARKQPHQSEALEPEQAKKRTVDQTAMESDDFGKWTDAHQAAFKEWVQKLGAPMTAWSGIKFTMQRKGMSPDEIRKNMEDLLSTRQKHREDESRMNEDDTWFEPELTDEDIPQVSRVVPTAWTVHVVFPSVAGAQRGFYELERELRKVFPRVKGHGLGYDSSLAVYQNLVPKVGHTPEDVLAQVKKVIADARKTNPYAFESRGNEAKVKKAVGSLKVGDEVTITKITRDKEDGAEEIFGHYDYGAADRVFHIKLEKGESHKDYFSESRSLESKAERAYLIELLEMKESLTPHEQKTVDALKKEFEGISADEEKSLTEAIKKLREEVVRCPECPWFGRYSDHKTAPTECPACGKSLDLGVRGRSSLPYALQTPAQQSRIDQVDRGDKKE